MRIIPITIAALAALIVVPSGAIAQGTLPPDNAAIDEYVEGVPGPTGKKPTGGGGSGGSGGGSGGSGGGSGGAPSATALPTGVVTQLQSLGSDGEAAADLAVATAAEPTRSARRGGGDAGAEPAGDGGANGDRTRSGVSEVVGQTLGAGTTGGMGVLLPLILVVALVGAIGAAWQRRHQGPGPSE